MRFTIVSDREPEHPAVEAARELALRVIGHAPTRLLADAEESFFDKGTSEPSLAALTDAIGADDRLTRCASAYALFLARPERAKDVVDHLVAHLSVNMATDLGIPDKLLAAMGEAAAEHLTPHVQHPMVAGVLKAIGPAARGAVPDLLDCTDAVGLPLAIALAHIGGERAVAAALPVLEEALVAPHPHLRKQALVGLASLGPAAASALRGIRDHTGDAVPELRPYAAVALLAAGAEEEAVGILANLAADRSIPDRHQVFSTLTSLGTSAAAARDALIAVAVAPDEGPGTRLAAARALQAAVPRDAEAMQVVATVLAAPVVVSLRAATR